MEEVASKSNARLCANENARVYEGGGPTAIAALRSVLKFIEGNDPQKNLGVIIHSAASIPSTDWDDHEQAFTATVIVA